MDKAAILALIEETTKTLLEQAGADTNTSKEFDEGFKEGVTAFEVALRTSLGIL
jgi:hypothetical protein